MVVNMLVVAEIFYLFNVRYLHMRSLTWRGAVGPPAVLGAIAVVAIAQLVYTYAPFMQTIFESRAHNLGDGALIVALRATLFLCLEAETLLMRPTGLLEELRAWWIKGTCLNSSH